MRKDQLIAYSDKYHGSSSLIKRALLRNEPYQKIETHDSIISILDEDYPWQLKRLSEPPYVLYLKGNVELLHQPKIAIVGSRVMGQYAQKATQQMIQQLRQHFVIVSGLAKGVDGCAHLSALQTNTATIAVLAFGFNYLYPKEHQFLLNEIIHKGLVLSQYPPHTPIEKFRFVERNRVIAALSDKVCVMQAGLKSGTMSTVNAALDCGIDVHCLPYHWDEFEGEGNNLLIQQGAFILTKFDELIKL